MMISFRYSIFLILLSSIITACSPRVTHGGDKAGSSEVTGALMGAGAGAITGFQVSAGSGPGAAVGAGFGAVAGSIQGIMNDQEEERRLRIKAETEKELERAKVHAILEEHLKKRIALHPSRDIYPADLFFCGDSSTLCKKGQAVIEEIARLNSKRMPWSRLVVASYVKNNSLESEYGKGLAERRARQIGDHLVRSGVEPRRLVVQGIVVNAPVLIDPDDYPNRYNQAVEFTLLDK